MQTAGYGDADDLVIKWREEGGELANAFGIAAFCQPDEQSAADAENIAAFDGAGKRDVLELAKFRDGLRKRRGFGAPRFCAERKNDGEFTQDNGGILDEHGIGEIGFGGKRNNISAEFF